MTVKPALLSLLLLAFIQSGPAWANGGEPLYYNRQIEAIYDKRGGAPLWKTLPDFQLVDELLLVAEGNGLSDQKAQSEWIKTLLAQASDNKGRALAERALLNWILELAHDLNGDSLPFSQLYTGWSFNRTAVDLPHAVAEAVSEGNIISFLAKLAPHDSDYLRLIQGLKLYRAIEETGGWGRIDQGPTLKPGMRDMRVRQVRARLEAEAYTLAQCRNEAEESTYDHALKAVVIEYQLRNGLEADGNIGAATLAALNKPVSWRIDQIRANMARARAMPREWPERSVVVNIADSSAKFMTAGHPPYLAPVIVGRPDRKTPFIASAINSIILNPSWTVPDRIAREDILPKLRKDPHYLQKMGFVIRQNEEDPHGALIDWDQVKKSEFVFRLRQAPGELNALGPIKFDFNNDFSVYMHGTPHKELFVKADRHLSSGCVRLEEPDIVAELVLSGNDGGWSREKVNEQIALKDRRWIKVKDPMPVYFIYQTVFYPPGSNQPHFRRDIYNYDRPLLAAMQERDK